MTGFDLSTISAVYVGNTSYSEIYYGSTKIWPAAQHDYSRDYLTLRSASDNNDIYFCWTDGGSSKTIDVSKDNGTTWTSYTSTAFIYAGERGTLIARLNAGDKLLIKGLQQTYKKNHLTPSGITDISGNIMSLFYGDNFIGQTSFPSNNLTNVCAYMFNSDLFRHAKNLILPATTLTESCYEGMFSTSDLNPSQLLTAPALPATTLAPNCYKEMFYNCTSLLTAPALPATTLADLCYYRMFRGCTSLTTAPELPATTLVQYCYYEMFYGCTSLTTAPALPATTLVHNCYYGMFMNCTSLTTPPALPATTLASYCYCEMFDGCTSLLTAPALPANNIYVNIDEYIYIVACYYRMFRGCTSLTTAPELLATKLSTGCYREMFSGCTSLNSVTCHATNISAEDCLLNWLDNVAATGDFYKDANITYPTGASGIPSGWTIHNIHDYSQDYLTFRILENGVIPWKQNSVAKTIEYSLNNGTWTSITSTSAGTMINVSQGDTIRFRGNNTTYCNRNKTAYSGFGLGQATGSYVTNAASFNVEGNIMSLIYGDNFANQTTFNGETYNFCSLFKKAKVVSAENLILPATTLTNYCYRSMFSYATYLETAPQLPATTLATGVYYYMFEHTAITEAPDLLAETLVSECYQSIFSNCSSLNYIKCLATNILTSSCTTNWTLNVAASGTFVKNSSMSSWTTGTGGIPSGWTVIDA